MKKKVRLRMNENVGVVYSHNIPVVGVTHTTFTPAPVELSSPLCSRRSEIKY